MNTKCPDCGYPNWKDMHCAGCGNIIKAQESTNGWISVKDRLPLEEESVLITEKEGYMVVAYITKQGHWYEETSGCGCCSTEPKPTHWMPLPELPDD